MAWRGAVGRAVEHELPSARSLLGSGLHFAEHEGRVPLTSGRAMAHASERNPKVFVQDLESTRNKISENEKKLLNDPAKAKGDAESELGTIGNDKGKLGTALEEQAPKVIGPKSTYMGLGVTVLAAGTGFYWSCTNGIKVNVERVEQSGKKLTITYKLPSTLASDVCNNGLVEFYKPCVGDTVSFDDSVLSTLENPIITKVLTRTKIEITFDNSVTVPQSSKGKMQVNETIAAALTGTTKNILKGVIDAISPVTNSIVKWIIIGIVILAACLGLFFIISHYINK